MNGEESSRWQSGRRKGWRTQPEPSPGEESCCLPDSGVARALAGSPGLS